ncbi:mucin-2-like isoform X2 [Anabas testudineus]|uniref:mucin-2-like isoform X2 n=1 Tax=Anabas testudineus TaxID=64144 RepID=UPI000E456F58|nr:mucin-2-like isoform X2 [Anabas testudineus]
MPLSLLLLLVLIYNTQANQFLGTVMTYYPNTNNTDGSVMVDLRYKLNFQSCTDLTWQCLTGNCGNESIAVNNVSVDSSGQWCQTEGISTRQVPSNAPFQLWLNGGNWIDNITNRIVSWRAVTLVELRTRSDTGKANASPQTTILPTVRVPSNCQRDFNLLAFDPDGDNVQCRNGNTSLSECNPCTPPSVLNLSSSCTLSFSPTSSSNEGPYAVQLMMEDFPRQSITLTETNGAQTTLTTNNAISQIPVQFVLWVDPVVPSCTEGLYLPQFLPPTPANGAQLFTLVNQTLEININAGANISTVSELLFSGPYNVIQSTSGPGQFTLRWTPSQREDGESYPICFVAKALDNRTVYQSNLQCVIVSVGNNPTTSTRDFTNLLLNVTLVANITDISTVNSTIPPPTDSTATPSPDILGTSTVTSTTPPSNSTNTPSPHTTDTSTVTSEPPPPTNFTTTPSPNTTATSTVTSTPPPPTNFTSTPSPNTTATSTVTSTPPPPTNFTTTPSPNTTATSTVTSTPPPPTNFTSTPSPDTTATSTVTSTPPPPTNFTTTPSPNTTATGTVTSAIPPPTNFTSTPSPDTTATSTVTSAIPPPTNFTSTPSPDTTATSTVTSASPPPTNFTTTPSPNTTATSTVTATSPPPTNFTTTPSPNTTATSTVTSTLLPPTPTPSGSTPASANYVVGLSVRVSSSLALASSDFAVAIQQLQSRLVDLGLPSGITIQIVRAVQR